MRSDEARNLVIDKYSNSSHMDRLTHTFGVAEMAEYLAGIYGVDKEKALVAAYMHDYCKYDPESDAIGVFTDEELSECNKFPFLYHAYLSAYAYKKMGGDDPDIFNAIRNHVFGRPNMSKLEEIIMIADFTEKNRRYPACIECREILLSGDLNKAIWYSLDCTIRHCKKRHEVIHPTQIIVHDLYEEKLK